jgi:hypothetical protein
MRNCNHIKSDGRPCNAPALRKHSYCFFHQQQLNRRRREYPDRLPILEDRAAVQVAIMQVLDRLYLKTIDYKAAALMLYGLQLASTNLKQDVFGRLNSDKVDRYYGNANETEQAGAPSKPAVGLGGSVALVPKAQNDRCPRSHAEGIDLGSDAGNVLVPEARDEGSPARSAGFQAPPLNTVPEGRPNTPAARLGGGAYKLDPERAAELERLFSETIPEINACVEETSDGCHSDPERSQRGGIPITEYSLWFPSSAHKTKLCPVFRDPRLETRDHSQLTTHHTPTRRAEHASPARQCWVQNRGEAPFLAAAGALAVLTTHNSRLTTHDICLPRP